MPSFTVTLPKGSRQETFKAFLAEKYPAAAVSVRREDPPESRADRLNVAQNILSEVQSEVEMLRDEVQEWHDNLPENLQSGTKADELDEAVSALEEVLSAVEEADNAMGNVMFPSMF